MNLKKWFFRAGSKKFAIFCTTSILPSSQYFWFFLGRLTKYGTFWSPIDISHDFFMFDGRYLSFFSNRRTRFAIFSSIIKKNWWFFSLSDQCNARFLNQSDLQNLPLFRDWSAKFSYISRPIDEIYNLFPRLISKISNFSMPDKRNFRFFRLLYRKFSFFSYIKNSQISKDKFHR